MDGYFINYNKKTIKKQYSGILHQSWSPEHIYVIFITITNRQRTEKNYHTKDKKEQGGKGD